MVARDGLWLPGIVYGCQGCLRLSHVSGMVLPTRTDRLAGTVPVRRTRLPHIAGEVGVTHCGLQGKDRYSEGYIIQGIFTWKHEGQNFLEFSLT